MTETLLPLWQCHKQVRASKIVEIDEIAEELELEHGSADLAGSGYFEKHKPQVGGYYVRYEDGYESWSPAEAFESGYTDTAKGFHAAQWCDEGSAEDLRDAFAQIDYAFSSLAIEDGEKLGKVTYERILPGDARRSIPPKGMSALAFVLQGSVTIIKDEAP